MSILASIPFILNLGESSRREKNREFECGFSLSQDKGGYRSLRFFVILVLFLVFDVEISLLLPLLLLPREREGVILLVVLLIAGLFLEWLEGAADWKR